MSTSETRRVRPQAMNTISLLKLASSALGIGPQATMRAAEHLYLSGFVSYPRTESTAYPSVRQAQWVDVKSLLISLYFEQSFDIKGTLQLVRGHPSLGNFASELLSEVNLFRDSVHCV